MPEQTDTPGPSTGAEPQFATPADFPSVKFDSKGLVPCIAQEWTTGEVLMLAYMNPESLRRTLATGTMWYFSRSRDEYWNKGATSGHFQTRPRAALRLRRRHPARLRRPDRRRLPHR